MRVQVFMRKLLHVEVGVMLVLAISMVSLSPEANTDLRIFEVFGAVTASALTTFGLIEMKQLTDS